MSLSPLLNLSSSYLQPLAPALSAVGSLLGGSTGAAGSSGLPLPGPSDNSTLSPFSQLLSTLQQLEQSNPAQYQQVTQQIATNLQSAAKSATSNGDTTAASELNQLATDFTGASQTGQLPNLQDLAHAIGGGHHHHHAHAHNSSSAATSLDQIVSSLGANGQSGQFDPESIIFQTLAGAIGN